MIERWFVGGGVALAAMVLLLLSAPANATIAVLDNTGTGTLYAFSDNGSPLNIFNGSNSRNMGYSIGGAAYRDVAVLSNGDIVVIGPVDGSGDRNRQITHYDVVGGTGTATTTLAPGTYAVRGAGLPNGGLAVYRGYPGTYQLLFYDAPVSGAFGAPTTVSLAAEMFKTATWGDNLYDDITLGPGQAGNTTDPDVAMVIFAPQAGTSEGIYYFDKTGAGDLDNILVDFAQDTYNSGAGITADVLSATNEARVMRLWGDADDLLKFVNGTPDTVTELMINSWREAWCDLAYGTDGNLLALNSYDSTGTAEGVWRVSAEGALLGSAPLIPMALSYNSRVDTYVPEPGTLGLLGLALVAGLRRRRRAGA